LARGPPSHSKYPSACFASGHAGASVRAMLCPDHVLVRATPLMNSGAFEF
jgi:hypothetical protein